MTTEFESLRELSF